MVLFFTATLGISVIAMLALLMVKRYELSSGSVFFAGARPALGAFFQGALFWVEKVLPKALKEYALRAVHRLKLIFWRSTAQSIIAFEYVLERVLHIVREKTAATRAPGEASAFLREVADHKKKLLRRAERPIVEE